MLLAAALLISSTQAGAKAPALDPTAAAAFVGDCVSAMQTDGIDVAAIEARGWVSMKIRSKQQKKLPFEAFSRPDGKGMLTASTGSTPAPECMVLVPANGEQGVEAVRDALDASFGARSTDAGSGESLWTPEGRRIALTPMGSPAKLIGAKIIVRAVKP
ncbi:hypothetical protein [Sphingopyxis panaciterrae]